MEEQLNILRTSKKFVILLMAGILISLYNLGVQEKMIVCGSDTETEQVLRCRQLLGSSIITAALIYFYKLTEKTAAAEGFGNETANNSYTAGALNLAAGLIRFADLLKS